jgi:hypothetical protein
MLTFNLPTALDATGLELTAEALLVTMTAADLLIGAICSENVCALPG